MKIGPAGLTPGRVGHARPLLRRFFAGEAGVAGREAQSTEIVAACEKIAEV